LREMLFQFGVGPSFVLSPGGTSWVIRAAREKRCRSSAALLWCFGYLCLYTSRSPVYQHGRYLMPAMPIFFLFGVLSFAKFDQSKTFGRYHWIAQTIWRGSMVMLVVAFVFLGAGSYAQDVSVIESEMVVTAKWVAENVPA